MVKCGHFITRLLRCCWHRDWAPAHTFSVKTAVIRAHFTISTNYHVTNNCLPRLLFIKIFTSRNIHSFIKISACMTSSCGGATTQVTRTHVMHSTHIICSYAVMYIFVVVVCVSCKCVAVSCKCISLVCVCVCAVMEKNAKRVIARLLSCSFRKFSKKNICSGRYAWRHVCHAPLVRIYTTKSCAYIRLTSYIECGCTWRMSNHKLQIFLTKT